jgi:two-component system response regulator (stage 0 sporulation protein F)
MTNILIVDDQACIRQVLIEELTREGYRVSGVGDGRSVRQHVSLSSPDLVVLDLYLDGPDGLGLFEDIKRQYPYLPVIIHTAYDTFREDIRLSQADGYVIKSMNLGVLKEEIADVLKRKAGSRETKTYIRQEWSQALEAISGG